jgi:hypothetical protein
MSQEQIQVAEKTQRLLHGPLKHVRAAALAAALLPLASVAVTPASAQSPGCTSSSGGVCGLVWNDINGNGIQEVGEPGLENVKVFVTVGVDVWSTETDTNGFYFFPVPEGTYPIAVTIPLNMQPSPVNKAPADMDSNGVSDTLGFSVATVTLVGSSNSDTDFGFFTTAVRNPGTGTPGYWKNHPEAWPVSSIQIGGVWYLKADAIIWLGRVGKDKTTTMFSSLVSAKLNVKIGNDSSCVASTISAADLWMTKPLTGYGPVGSGVAASSYAWSIGEPLHQQMDAYNNGLLCAPHRN